MFAFRFGVSWIIGVSTSCVSILSLCYLECDGVGSLRKVCPDWSLFDLVSFIIETSSRVLNVITNNFRFCFSISPPRLVIMEEEESLDDSVSLEDIGQRPGSSASVATSQDNGEAHPPRDTDGDGFEVHFEYHNECSNLSLECSTAIPSPAPSSINQDGDPQSGKTFLSGFKYFLN